MTEEILNDFLGQIAGKSGTPLWMRTLLKTLISKNITIEDWNELVKYVRYNASDISALTDFIKLIAETPFVNHVSGTHSNEPMTGDVVLGLLDLGVSLTPSEINSLHENIIELNHRLRLKFFLGTKNEIESVAEKEDDVIYVATDGMPDIEELIYKISVLEEQLKNCTCGN